MTPDQVLLVKESWEKVAPISEKAAELFYGRLFEMDPSLKPLFKSDMKEQGKKLMSTLGMCVASLDRLEAILPAVEKLGRKHAVDYHVPDSSYDTVGAAFLWTLEQGLGDEFTDEVRDAWTETYTTLANVMKGAAAGS